MANFTKYLTWEKVIQFVITVLTAIATTFGVSSCKAATLQQDPWHEKDPELATPRVNGNSAAGYTITVRYQAGVNVVKIFKDGVLVLTDTITDSKSGVAYYNMKSYGTGVYTYTVVNDAQFLGF